jgi:uncharacterized integral membrane protein
MTVRTVALLILPALLVLFAVFNWGTFIAPTRLSLLVTSVEAPLGLVMLGFVALLTVVFLGYLMFVQASALAAGRRQADELRQQRELADKAEASRFTELREYLAGEFEALRAAQNDSAARLRQELTETASGLAASIGEVDDRLERQWPTPPERQP